MYNISEKSNDKLILKNNKKLVEKEINEYIKKLTEYQKKFLNNTNNSIDAFVFLDDLNSGSKIILDNFEFNENVRSYTQSLKMLKASYRHNINAEVVNIITSNIGVFELILDEIKDEDNKKNQEDSYINEIKEFIDGIEKENIKSYFNELVLNLENQCYRSAIIMSWVGAVSVLQEYVFKNKLDKFNDAGKNRNSKFKEVESMGDFANHKESDFLEIICSAGIIDRNVKKILNHCLDDRNISGHPNEAVLSKQTALKQVEELINNVYKKFM